MKNLHHAGKCCLVLTTLIFLCSGIFFSRLEAQCDTEVSGVFTYCNAVGVASGYMVAFRVKDLTGTTLNVVDLTGQVPDNRGKRINDINTQVEPATVTIAPLVIGGGLDSLEFWYFGPFANNTPFDIALVDPTNTCDTIFIASGTYDCTDGTGTSDPGACDADVPLYFLDFSQTEFSYGGGGGGNENLDEIFLIMQRARESVCCDVQPANQRCFEFIVQLADEDIGLAIDDIGSGATAGEFYADTISMFTCTGTPATTWPFTQANGQSSDIPVCLTSSPGENFVVLSCKSGNNITGVSIDAISNLFAPPEVTIEPCNVSIEVFGADSVMWSSPDDPNLDNLISCNGDSSICMFFYDVSLFGEVTTCEGDTFTYIVSAMPSENECLGVDTILMDTTYVIVYPTFTVEIDTVCNTAGDSLILTADIISAAIGCPYDFFWSTGDSTQTITIPFSTDEIFVTVTRDGMPPGANACVVAVDSISALGGLSVDCSNIQDTLYSCISELPDPDNGLVTVTGCGLPVYLIYNNDQSNGGAGCVGDSLIITRYYIVDFDGDTITTTTDRDTCAQALVFVDEISPSLGNGCPPGVTVSCASQVPAIDPSSIFATDNCGGLVTVSGNDVISNMTCVNRFTITRTYTASDACGNSATCNQIINVFDATIPTLTCPGPVTVQCASQVPAVDINSVTAESDNCGGIPTVTHVSDITTAQTCANRFVLIRTYAATDECGNSATCTQGITVFDNTIPTLTCPIGITVQCANQIPAPDVNGVTAESDNCDSTPAVSFVSDVTSNFVCTNRLTLSRTYRATDECGNSATCTQIFTVFDNTVPTLTCPANVTVQCVSLVPAADINGVTSESDNCGGVPTVSFVSDVTSNIICANRLTVTRTYRATDACGNSATCSQIITVFDNTIPTLTCPTNVTVQCTSQVPPVDINGVTAESDNCGGIPTITFVSDVTSNITCVNRFTVTRTYRATDECGNSGTCTQIITVFDNTAPTLTCPADVTVQCASLVPAADINGVTAESDNCGGVPTVTFVSDVTTNVQCANRFTLVRTYRATDECGNSGTCAQIITVFDNTAPTLTCPAGVTVQCLSLVPPVDINSITAESDNCNGTPTVTFVSDVTSNVICANRLTLTRTYRATDECGNSATCTQTITVFDNTSPTLTCPGNVTVQCASLVPAPDVNGVTAEADNCNGVPTITFVSDITSNQTCVNRFTLTRTYRATDECGNSATCAQVITVFDNTAPAISCPVNTTISPEDSTDPANTGNATASDNCGGTPTITFNDVTVAGECEQNFIINRTFTATDACGNTATCLQVISVEGGCNVDLSLTKDLVPGQGTIAGGDDVTFTITISNDGEVTIGSVTITDYIPVGFTLNDPDWTPGTQGSTGQSASITLSTANGGLDVNGLETGESVSVQITLQADINILPGSYVNTAEISVVLDLAGNDVTDNDIDSDPDDDDTNDVPGEDDIDDAIICVLPQPVIVGDNYVCPGEIVVYTVENYNPNNTYVWLIQNGGGVIIADDGQSITVEWGDEPGGAFVIQLTEIAAPGCQATAFFNVFIQGLEALACNDHINISIDEDCSSVILSGMILEGELFGDDNYIVIIIDQNGDTIPNATVTSEHVGQTFTVKVMSECNNQSCWGTITIEDKIGPTIECACPVEGVEITGFSGTLDAESATFTRPNTMAQGGTCTIGAAGVPYIAFPFYLDMAGSNQFDVVTFTAPGADSFIALYADSFNPNAPCENLVAADDDAGPNFLSQIVATLEADRTYVMVFTTFNNSGDDFGDFEVTISGNSTVFLVDPACQITCLDVEQLLAGIIPPDLLPTATDNCGEPVVTIVDVETNYDNCAGGFVLVTYQAIDASGNTATCIQEFTLIPLTLDSLVFPPAYEGICGGSIEPEVTGWPSVDGINLNDEGGLCNIFTGYWDKELNECGGGRKIVRTWTVLDWCSLEIVEGVQVIKLTDNEPPALTCPANITVGTDFWYCYANVSVPKPVAIDECSAISSYHLATSSGVIVQFGNNFAINGLLIGTHIITWTVTDECGNSSTCSFTITVKDDVVPVANCDQHTVVSLTNDGPYGLTLVPASVFDDGSYDNCGPVTFRARRMDSCIDFDWTTEGACIDDVPGGIPPVNSRDRGTVHRSCVPFACCDIGAGPVMVEFEVTDAAGNVNFCMVEVIVQDKISPFVECPPDITVSCDYWFPVEEGTFVDQEGNNNGQLDEDPLSDIFGNIFDDFRYSENARQSIIINDPGNNHIFQPHHWGIDGWADDNCQVNLQVRVRIFNDCSGDDLPANAPPGAVKLIERRFSASDGNEGSAPGTCTQRIWVVDFDPFYITDQNCNNANPNDGVIWPCDVVLTTCPDSVEGTGEPIIFDDACSLIGVAYEDTRFDFVDGACFKILREWKIIDWCQYEPLTGYGIWSYTQVIKVHDEDGPEFLDCPAGPVVLCVADEGIRLPASNQAFLGEDDPNASSCSVHVTLRHTVREACSGTVKYDVKIYPFNGNEFIQVKPTSTAIIGEDHTGEIYFDTEESPIQSIRKDGLPYNSPWCGNYHRVLWSVEDGCGKWSSCEYLIRLEDCKQPSPVCINGLSTVVMPFGGQVTIWAKDFNASSFDDCTASEALLYSFSGDAYQPSFTFTCDNVPAFGVELVQQIWVADGGVDHNCNSAIEWSERNKDFCTTSIVITDNANVCDTTGSVLEGEILTPHGVAVSSVNVSLTSGAQHYPVITTDVNGNFRFNHLHAGAPYLVKGERNDDHKNGVSTLDLVKIQKHLLGRELFSSPYQYIAADANNSAHVSAIDLIELRRLILGIYTELPHSKSWVMVDKNFVMDNPENPWPYNSTILIDPLLGDYLDADFIGVKVGDVNNTVKANAQQVQTRGNLRILSVHARDLEEIHVGETVDVEFVIPEMVSGFQWTFETSGLEFMTVSSEDVVIDGSHVGVLDKGIVTMSWNGEMISGQGQEIRIRMQWIATQAGELKDMISMTDAVTAAEAYTTDDEILDVKLRFDGSEVAKEFALYQNQPNPWNSETQIGFDLPADGDATLTVYDVSGKVVLVKEGQYKAGYTSVVIPSKEMPAYGVFYYKLESGGFTATKKMILVR